MAPKKRSRKPSGKKPAVAPSKPVVIRVPREDRLKTIHSLAETVAVLAQALNATSSVHIAGCYFDAIPNGPALCIENNVLETNEFTIGTGREP